jgi:hypothetical protein
MTRLAVVTMGIWLLGAAAFAQDAPPRPASSQGPMTVERIRNGFAIAPDVKVTDISSRTGVLMGGYGGWMVDNTLLLGAGGYGLVNDARVHGMGYGGFVAEWLQRTDRPIGYSVRGLLGFGSASLDRTVMQYPPRPFFRDEIIGPPGTPVPVTVRTRNDFFVAEPQANLLINLSNRLRVGIGAGYRFVSAEHGVSNRLSGATGSIMVQFGGSRVERLPQP